MYKRQILCYVIVSLETTFSTMWFLQLIGFVAVGVISDALSQVGSYYYGCFRFKKDIQESKILKIEIEEAIKNHGDELMQQTIPSYDSHQIIQQYFQEDKMCIRDSFVIFMIMFIIFLPICLIDCLLV